ncbi:MAG: cyclic nucleotide-binding domain-containing protein [Alphaproteobacteria bacterium]|nr:cyclic nucleotide-binding domain-containing protein [Alphaproteobacteria bacterium]
MRRINLSAGDTLFEKGDVADEAFLIMDGVIEISSDALTAELVKDELFGESGLVGNARQASATAKTDCRLFAVSVDELRGSITADPDTALVLIEALIRRLADTLSKLEEAKHLVS